MIKCVSRHAYYNMCVAEMSGLQSQGGTICCDAAEDCDFDIKEILKQCPYAVKVKNEQDNRLN